MIKWEVPQITFIARLQGNRLIFMLVFNEQDVFLVATKVNSLRMNIILHYKSTYSIRSVHVHGQYLYELRDDRIAVGRILDQKLASLLEASDNMVKTDFSNRQFVEYK